jgi:hypothetical protein
MALTDMQVFNQYFMPATIETLAQMVDKFNAASAGSIVLSTEGFDGDFIQESFFKAIHSAQRRVDRYASITTQSPTDLTQDVNVGVKVAGGFGPIRYEPAQMTWLRKPTAEGIEVASRNFAEALLRDQLNTAIASLVAAISNQATATNDITAGTNAVVTYAAINNGHALFGDRSNDIVANVMTGSMYHKLVSQNLTNSTRLFQSAGVTVVDILNKAVVVTDAPALSTTGSPGTDVVLGLTPNAAIVHDAGDVVSNIETVNGNTRIVTTMQVDYSFGLRLKGYKWDIANGGKSPTDSELATGSNWDLAATDIKQTAGVVIIGDKS